MPKEVIYGPPELFGIGIHDYYIEQGIHQLLALFGHIRQNSETSRMMRIELQWCQVQAGTTKRLLAEPTDDIDSIETCWIMSIRDFLRTYGLSIDMTTNEEPGQTIPSGQISDGCNSGAGGMYRDTIAKDKCMQDVSPSNTIVRHSQRRRKTSTYGMSERETVALFPFKNEMAKTGQPPQNLVELMEQNALTRVYRGRK